MSSSEDPGFMSTVMFDCVYNMDRNKLVVGGRAITAFFEGIIFLELRDL
jgi:hypothetical protein